MKVRRSDILFVDKSGVLMKGIIICPYIPSNTIKLCTIQLYTFAPKLSATNAWVNLPKLNHIEIRPQPSIILATLPSHLFQAASQRPHLQLLIRRTSTIIIQSLNSSTLPM